MNVTLLRQTRPTNCGQTAVAMLTGKTIEEIEKVYGHKRTTFSGEHVNALNKLGIPCDQSFSWFFKDRPELPEVALVRIAYLKRSGGHFSTTGKTKRSGHLVLWANGQFYDPSGKTYTRDNMPAGMIIDRYLKVMPKVDTNP